MWNFIANKIFRQTFKYLIKHNQFLIMKLTIKKGIQCQKIIIIDKMGIILNGRPTKPNLYRQIKEIPNYQ